MIPRQCPFQLSGLSTLENLILIFLSSSSWSCFVGAIPSDSSICGENHIPIVAYVMSPTPKRNLARGARARYDLLETNYVSISNLSRRNSFHKNTYFQADIEKAKIPRV